MNIFDNFKLSMFGVDEHVDYNDFDSVVAAMAQFKKRLLTLGLSVILTALLVGYVFEFSMGILTVIILWFPIVLIGNVAHFSLMKAKGLDCTSCGCSLIIPLSQGKTYYQCKKCGTKP